MSNEHTPGPWEVIDSRHVSTGKTLYLFENVSASAGELRANARLIAAAPELLSLAREAADASETVRALLCGHGEATKAELVSIITGIGAKATALINKATGE